MTKVLRTENPLVVENRPCRPVVLWEAAVAVAELEVETVEDRVPEVSLRTHPLPSVFTVSMSFLHLVIKVKIVHCLKRHVSFATAIVRLRAMSHAIVR